MTLSLMRCGLNLRAVPAILLLLGSCSGEKAPQPVQTPAHSAAKSLQCPQAGAPILVDGRIEDAWSGAGTLVLDDPADVADPNAVKIYVLWDESYLYVAYDVSDKFLAGFQSERDHKELYKDDMIEVLLDPRRDRTDLWLEDDIVYHVNLLGQVKDDRGTPEGKATPPGTAGTVRGKRGGDGGRQQRHGQRVQRGAGRTLERDRQNPGCRGRAGYKFGIG